MRTPAAAPAAGWWPLPRPWLLLALVLHVLPFVMRPALIGGDEPHYALMAHSLAVDHDADLRDDYTAVATGSAAAGGKRRGERLEPHLRSMSSASEGPGGSRERFAHPLGVPLLAAPLVAVQQALSPGAAPDVPLALLGSTLTFAALVAGCGLLGRVLGPTRADAEAGAVAGLLAYFSSPLWFYSRTFFTEPYSWSLCVLGIAAAARRRLALAALLFGLTLATKEMTALLVVPVLVAAARGLGLRRAAVLALGPLAIVAIYVAANLAITGRPLGTLQPFQLGSPLRGALGLLAAPDRGLLWFAPLLVLGTVGWWKGRWTAPDVAAAAAFAGYFAVTAAWIDWRGGTCYGPRLLVPVLPALALPLARLVARARTSPRWRLALGGLATAGFTVGWCAAFDPVSSFWDSRVGHLLGMQPLATAGGIALGAWLAWRALRRVGLADAGPAHPPVLS
jgi:hypothetical protein